MNSNNQSSKIQGKVWTSLIIFGLIGQVAWVIENMYLNVYIYKTVTYDPDAIAIMVAASAAIATIASLVMGVLSDKMGKRKAFITTGYMIWGFTIMGFAAITTDNVGAMFPNANVITLTVAFIVILDCIMTYIGSTANDAAYNAWLTDVTNPKNRGKAEGVVSSLPLISMLVVFGGLDFLTQQGKWTSFFMIIGIIVTLSGVLGLFLIKDAPIVKVENSKYFKDLLYGFKPSVIKENKFLYLILTTIAIYATALQVFMPYLIIYIEFYLGITDYAIILGIVLILAAIASVIFGRLVDKYGKSKFLLISGIIFPIGLIILYILGETIVDNVSLTTIMLGIFGSIMMGANLLISLILNAGARDFMPKDRRGLFAGIRMIFFVLIPMVIGPFVGSTIIKNSNMTYVDEFGVLQSVPIPGLFLGAAIISLLALIPVFFIIKRYRKKLPNEKLYTRWGKDLDPKNVLQEYPRPQLQRDSYINLNGEWNYAIYPKAEEFEGYQGKIVVPFSPECLLSGVGKVVTPTDKIYYRRTFNVEKSFIKDKTIIHFGASDYRTKVWLNDVSFGRHSGGFMPFSVDISSAIKEGENEIRIEVTDPTDTRYISRGKQSLNSGGIWYTPQSGIWQTVWMESVDKVYIEKLKIIPDIDNNVINIKPIISGEAKNIKASIMDNGEIISKVDLVANENNTITLDAPKLWSPESPHLYDLEVVADNDKVNSYFGMRKFHIANDEKGYTRIYLNNKPYFQNGLLDQGYWSDGMLTPPSDDAMLYDIKKMKELGFNMLRKHIKVEPLRWYYHCDREGMLVWQDMINGGGKYSFLTIGALPFLGKLYKDDVNNYKRFSREEAKGRQEYYSELDTMIDVLYNCVSICVWVPFNEGWGQFDALKAVDFIKERDKTRLIDHASGWHDQGGGDFNSLHIYFTKIKLPKDDKRAVVLSEFGGYSYRVDNHVFNKHRMFGYRIFKKLDKYQEGYKKLYENSIIPQIDKGLAASIYTQVSDVEDEINGILTYDREVCKLNADEIKELNSRIKL